MTSRLNPTLVAIATILAMLVPLGSPPTALAATPPRPSGPGAPCPGGAPLRRFDINAIQVDMVFNKYGLHNPQGMMYVLGQNRDPLLEMIAANPGQTVSLLQPLTIRASIGDCIEVTFRNELSQNASIHPTGVSYDVLGSDGQAVGFNPDTTAAPGATVTYRWYPEKEGPFFFADGADQTYVTDPSGGRGTRSNGLFGALIVEPAGATWTDARTGQPLLSGVQADIHLPNAPDFREIVPFFHDGIDIMEADGSRPVDLNGEQASLYALNYRGDPMFSRLRENCPDCAEESQFYSSSVHGDPGGGDLVFPVYVGDPVVMRLIGAQVEEVHVQHLHVHRWKSDPDSPDSNTIDSQMVSPGAAYTNRLAFGAGYKQGTVGDVLFHCHLFPHYFNGMWGIMRVNDKLRPDLQPLPDRTAPPQATADSPGYPNFIQMNPGLRNPHPPDPDLRPPTPLEQTALNALQPGAPNVDPCPSTAPVRQYHVVAIQLDLKLNKAGDHVPKGRIYVPAEDELAVLSGAKKPEPLVLRANKDDCVQVTLENHLPPDDLPNEMGIHIHYVAFDVLGSDGTAVGYNYDEGIRPGEMIRYRWWADEEGTIFLHDHQSHSAANGAFGQLAVEPQGSQWLHPQTGLPMTTGTQAMIVPPGAAAFRELALFYQDQVDAVDRNGVPLNPPAVPESRRDHGVMAMNYTNAPFYRRTGADPAYTFSSWVNGDPDTPIFEAYPGDPVKIRLVQGSMEEQHNFVMHGVRWKQEPNDQASGDMAGESIGTSEYFNFEVQANPAGVLERDYLYGSMAIDDLWNGMWGLFRVWGGRVDHLQPLPDRAAPLPGINPGDLARLTRTGTPPPTPLNAGNPCPLLTPVRTFDISAFTRDIPYNHYGDHDPYGILYSLTEDEQAIRDGTKPAEPLAIRANAGDCIQVVLRNHLPATMDNQHEHAKVPVDDASWPNSSRISLHAQLVQYDVEGSDGATVGYNFDQTVPAGGVMSYTWYADKELGTSVLWDMADVRSHRHHGAFGTLIIEPQGATYRDPKTGGPRKSGAEADIVVPGGADFREYVLMFSDGMYIVNPSGNCPVPVDPDDPVGGNSCNQMGDHEDQGFKGINNRSAPFSYRLAQDPRKQLLFSSHVHGDPDTPILRAYLGDPVRIRMADPGDKPRGMAVHLAGHLWPHFWAKPDTLIETVRGGLTPGLVADIVPLGGAGGLRGKTGDWLYQEMKQRRYLEGGLWGLMRVINTPVGDLNPLPDRRPAAPTALAVNTPAAQFGTLDISWSASVSPNVVGYNVHRSLLGSSLYQKVNAALVTGSTYHDTGLLGITTYYYVVTAVDRFGNESVYSSQASGRTNPPLTGCLYTTCRPGSAGLTASQTAVTMRLTGQPGGAVAASPQ